MKSLSDMFYIFHLLEDTKFGLKIFEIDFVIERGSYKVWEINMGVCPRLEFDNIMFINCLGYDFYINGAFELL